VTYDVLADRIERLAAGLRARELAPGFVAAIWAPNMPQWAAFALGVMRAGGAVTGVSPAATERELADQLRDARAEVLVTVPARAEAALRAAETAGVREVVVIGEAAGVLSADELLAAGDDRRPVSVDVAPDDLGLLPYSSGTTGLPRA
jgi:acyl-CoA synthetase (AMP-forming)/AMP-acid ligase II